MGLSVEALLTSCTTALLRNRQPIGTRKTHRDPMEDPATRFELHFAATSAKSTREAAGRTGRREENCRETAAGAAEPIASPNLRPSRHPLLRDATHDARTEPPRTLPPRCFRECARMRKRHLHTRTVTMPTHSG
jgi:hypothetical protein